MARKFVLIVAGEASGDTYAAQVVRALKEREPSLSFFGIGGKRLEGEGVKVIFPCQSLAVVGIVEVLGRLPAVLKAWKVLTDAIKTLRPRLAILVDFPGFNLRLARRLKGMGVPVLYYVAPQVWAWWPRRAKAIARGADRLAVILPFEVDFFKAHGIDATFVGHPQREVLKGAPSRKEARALLHVGGGQRVVGIFPGSRQGEVDRHWMIMVEACRILKGDFPDLRFFAALAPGVKISEGGDWPVEPVPDGALTVMAASDLMLAASGTVTLQGALMGIPMVVVYRVNPLSFLLGKALVKVPYISLPNLLLGKPLVPELIQGEATPGRIALEAKSLLEDEERRKEMAKGFEVIRGLLPEGAPDRVAQMALEMLEG